LKPDVYYIAIDGGATKTAFLLSDGEKTVNELRLGPCNPVDIGLEEMHRLLERGINELTDGWTELKSCFLFAGISGILTGDYRERTKAFLKRLGFSGSDCGSDADNIIAAGLKDRDGIVGIMGTGSVLFAVKNGVGKRFGGYGNFFDTALSGFTLGCEAIKAVLAYEEGSGDKTLLRELLLENLGKNSALENLGEYYRGGKQYVASFAPLTLRAAAEKDQVALQIIKKAAGETARLIMSAQKYVEAPCKAVFTGGLAEGAEKILFPMIGEELKDVPVDLELLREAPVQGALVRAMRLNRKEGE